jgi:hypothetical protein
VASRQKPTATIQTPEAALAAGGATEGLERDAGADRKAAVPTMTAAARTMTVMTVLSREPPATRAAQSQAVPELTSPVGRLVVPAQQEVFGEQSLWVEFIGPSSGGALVAASGSWSPGPGEETREPQHGFGADPAVDALTAPLDVHQTRLPHLLEMVRDRRGGQTQILAQFASAPSDRLGTAIAARGSAAGCELDEDAQSLRVAETLEHLSEPVEISVS